MAFSRRARLLHHQYCSKDSSLLCGSRVIRLQAQHSPTGHQDITRVGYLMAGNTRGSIDYNTAPHTIQLAITTPPADTTPIRKATPSITMLAFPSSVDVMSVPSFMLMTAITTHRPLLPCTGYVIAIMLRVICIVRHLQYTSTGIHMDRVKTTKIVTRYC